MADDIIQKVRLGFGKPLAKMEEMFAKSEKRIIGLDRKLEWLTDEDQKILNQGNKNSNISVVFREFVRFNRSILAEFRH